MAIEFEHRGRKYRADTAKEAAELQFELDRHDSFHCTYAESKHWTSEPAMDVLKGIGELQKKFVAVLSDMASPLKSNSLVERMKLDSEVALAGVISGLSKQLRKMSINPSDLYRVEVVWKGKGKERFFALSPDFKKALTELGWPDARKSEERGSDAHSTKHERK